MASKKSSRANKDRQNLSVQVPISPVKSATKSSKKLVDEDEVDGTSTAMAFKVLSADQCNELLSLGIDNMEIKICDIFSLNNHLTDLKEASILDYYTGAVWWAKENSFNQQQLSGFFTVIHTLLDNVKEKHLSMVDNMKEYQKMVAGIGVENSVAPSGGLEFFNVKQAKMVTEYVYTGLFQHYKLFEFMFSHTQAEEIIGTDLDVEVAMSADVPFPPPLDEGISTSMYEQFVATPPPSPTPEPKEETQEEEIDISPYMPENSDVFAELTADDIKSMVESISSELMVGLSADFAKKLQEKENQLITKINKIHKVAQ